MDPPLQSYQDLAIATFSDHGTEITDISQAPLIIPVFLSEWHKILTQMREYVTQRNYSNPKKELHF